MYRTCAQGCTNMHTSLQLVLLSVVADPIWTYCKDIIHQNLFVMCVKHKHLGYGTPSVTLYTVNVDSLPLRGRGVTMVTAAPCPCQAGRLLFIQDEFSCLLTEFPVPCRRLLTAIQSRTYRTFLHAWLVESCFPRCPFTHWTSPRQR